MDNTGWDRLVAKRRTVKHRLVDMESFVTTRTVEEARIFGTGLVVGTMGETRKVNSSLSGRDSENRLGVGSRWCNQASRLALTSGTVASRLSRFVRGKEGESKGLEGKCGDQSRRWDEDGNEAKFLG